MRPRCCCIVLFTITVSFCPFIAFGEGVLPYPVGLYPFNDLYKTADASCYGNLGGTAQDVELAAGPSGKANNAYKFAGIGTSYINIPGSQHLDTKNSITILVWIFQTGHPGSIIQYLDSNRDNGVQTAKTNSVEIRTSRVHSISAIFVERSGDLVTSLTNDTINLEEKWLYIGASYDHNSGYATLWIDGNAVQQMNLGKLELRTNRDIQVGSGHGKGDSFEGRISCIQIYDRALSQREVAVVKKRCFMNNHPPVDCSKTSAPSGCGVFMNTLSGRFSSPGYPAGYPHNAKCVWEIEVPSGYIIILKFSTFDLEASYSRPWPDCPDYVMVFDGINSWSKRLLVVCGDPSDVEGEISSSGNGLRVEFVSDENHSASGFTASYSASLINADKGPEDDMIDFSRHYTGIVIGVACAAIFAILSIITFSHTRRRLRERRHGSLTRSNRHSVSFSENDVFQQNAPPTYDDVMRYPELYPPTPCQGSLANTPAMTPRRGSPVSTPTVPHRLLNRPAPSPTLVPKVGTPIGMPFLNARRGLSSPQSTSRVSLQRGISPLARAELIPQHSRHADHMSSDEHDDVDDDELPPYPGIMNVDLVLDQVRETLQQGRFASRQASNPSLSNGNSSNGNHNKTANGQRDSQASVAVRDHSGVIETRLEPNRNSAASVQSFGNNTHGHTNPWVASNVPRTAVPGGTLRSVESVV